MTVERFHKYAILEGVEQGLQQGREIGMQEGRIEGLQEGSQQKALETAKNLLALNLLSIEQIASSTGLTVEEVSSLQ